MDRYQDYPPAFRVKVKPLLKNVYRVAVGVTEQIVLSPFTQANKAMPWKIYTNVLTQIDMSPFDLSSNNAL